MTRMLLTILCLLVKCGPIAEQTIKQDKYEHISEDVSQPPTGPKLLGVEVQKREG
jgi:hypothetical protein